MQVSNTADGKSSSLQTDPTADNLTLKDLLAARESVCVELSEQQVRLSAIVERQAREIERLEHALSETQTNVGSRFEEIAKLSSIVLRLDESLAKTNDELASKNRELESQTSACQDLARSLERSELRFREEQKTYERTKQLDNKTIEELEKRLILLELETALCNTLARSNEAMIAWHRNNEMGYRSELDRIKSSSPWKWMRRFLGADLKNEFIPDSAPPDHYAGDEMLLRNSDLFDPQWYAAQCPDGSLSGMDQVGHFLRIGTIQGLNPSRSFNMIAYVTHYPDVRKSGVNPLVHYIKYGKDEGRKLFPVESQTDD